MNESTSKQLPMKDILAGSAVGRLTDPALDYDARALLVTLVNEAGHSHSMADFWVGYDWIREQGEKHGFDHEIGVEHLNESGFGADRWNEEKEHSEFGFSIAARLFISQTELHLFTTNVQGGDPRVPTWTDPRPLSGAVPA